MALHYLDSSALIKAYIRERGSHRVRDLVLREPVVISVLAIAEAASSFARKTRERLLTDEQRLDAHRSLVRDAQGFAIIPVLESLVAAAARRMIERPDIVVRAADAIHLATAEQSFILARQAGVTDCVFVCADRRLSDAARAVGLTVEDPSAH